MTHHDPPDSNPPLPDCAVVRARPDGVGVTIDKSVVEAALDETDHGLVPDDRCHRATDDLLDVLVESFSRVSPFMDHDIVDDRHEAARALQYLHDSATPVYVTRRER